MKALAIAALAAGLLAPAAPPAHAADADKFYLLAAARYSEFAGDARLGAGGVAVSFEVDDSKLRAPNIGLGYQAHPKFALELRLSYVDGDAEPENLLGNNLADDERTADELSLALFGDSTEFSTGDPSGVTLEDALLALTCVSDESECRAGLDLFDFQSVDLAVNALWSPFANENSRLKAFLGAGVLHRWSEWTARYRVLIGEEDVSYEREIKQNSFYGIATLGLEYRASRYFSWVPSVHYGFAVDRDDANYWGAELALKYAFQ